MKKNYLSPLVETTKMRFNYVICGTTLDNGEDPISTGGTPGGPIPKNPAPRKPF